MRCCVSRSVGGYRSGKTGIDGTYGIAPPGARLLAIVGDVPPYGRSDGLVSIDSATLGGRIPSVTTGHSHANHLNVTGVSNVFGRVLRGFMQDDSVWPTVVGHVRSFVPVEEPEGTQAAREALALQAAAVAPNRA